MSEDKIEINVVDEHDPKYNLSKERVDAANDAIRKMSQLKNEESGVDTEIVGKKIIHKRTEEDYQTIWAAFLSKQVIVGHHAQLDENQHPVVDSTGTVVIDAVMGNNATYFREQMGYGQKEIEEIGIKKFIDAMDWNNEEDVVKWMTDTLRVIICCHCKNDFAVFSFLDLGLCHECENLYDKNKVIAAASTLQDQEEFKDLNVSLGMTIDFVYKPDVRIGFLKEQEV